MDTTDAHQTLIDHAEGRIQHLGNGSCPDGLIGHAKRDDACPVCQALQQLQGDHNQLLKECKAMYAIDPAGACSKYSAAAGVSMLDANRLLASTRYAKAQVAVSPG